jgi:hypothetical protein
VIRSIDSSIQRRMSLASFIRQSSSSFSRCTASSLTRTASHSSSSFFRSYSTSSQSSHTHSSSLTQRRLTHTHQQHRHFSLAADFSAPIRQDISALFKYDMKLHPKPPKPPLGMIQHPSKCKCVCERESVCVYRLCMICSLTHVRFLFCV